MTFSSRRASSREGSLDQYLKEISQYPLIDRAEEARLAKLIPNSPMLLQAMEAAEAMGPAGARAPT